MHALYGVLNCIRYESKKKVEHFLTGTLCAAEVSCQPSDKYGNRFAKFMSGIITG